MFIDNVADYEAHRRNTQRLTVSSKKSGVINVPCMNTLMVARDMIVANTYNPNSVAKDKMKLLRKSIRENGFCFPIVTIFDEDQGRFVIIDGFHRYTMASEAWLDMSHIPVVALDHDISKRMYATVQFNKARGVHQVDMDADVIRALIEQGNSEDEVAENLGIDVDTVHRYKQLTGIAALFAKANYSPSWSMKDLETYVELENENV